MSYATAQAPASDSLAIDAFASEEVSRLLDEAKDVAFQLTDDASSLISYTGAYRNEQECHENYLWAAGSIRTHIRTANHMQLKLDQARNSCARWQRSALDRIAPLLRQIADNTSDLLRCLDENPERLRKGTFQEYIEANAETASRFAGLIVALVDFERSLGRAQAQRFAPGRSGAHG
jgi:hypothetical protein